MPQLSEEHKRKMREGRKLAISKSLYSKAIRQHCTDCAGPYPIRCRNDKCSLFNLRTQKLRQLAKKKDLIRTIKRECAQCLGIDKKIINNTNCTSPNCGLFPFRLIVKLEQLTEAVAKRLHKGY